MNQNTQKLLFAAGGLALIATSYGAGEIAIPFLPGSGAVTGTTALGVLVLAWVFLF